MTPVACVYKPIAGERPLWDFPDGTLAGREYAAYLLSAAAGWNLVPPTVLRDGPAGPGMCQLWVEASADEEVVDLLAPEEVPPGWLGVLEGAGADGKPVILAHADDPRLRAIALFDLVINNADRKGGHILPTGDQPGPSGSGRLWAIDHGVCFAAQDKLRTVLWGWAGQPMTDAERALLSRTAACLTDNETADRLAELLTAEEVTATADRIARLLADPVFPFPADDRPPIPWPPF